MDGSLAIEENRQALKRIVAMLVEMAGLADDPHPEVPAEGGPRRAIPRILWRAILALLRPAESAARRLIIATSQGLVVAPPRPCRAEPAPPSMEPLLRRFGIAVTGARGGVSAVAGRAKADGGAAEPCAQSRMPAFPLFDPPRRLSLYGSRPHFVPAHAAPRILVPGLSEPAPLPRPPSIDDGVGTGGITRRLAALGQALDDLPGQARRFARRHARLRAEAARAPSSPRRVSALRRGRPPGGRLARYDPNAAHPPKIREVDEILAHAHSMALYVLENPDTS